jgi:hypothetical protein
MLKELCAVVFSPVEEALALFPSEELVELFEVYDRPSRELLVTALQEFAEDVMQRLEECNLHDARLKTYFRDAHSTNGLLVLRPLGI